MKNTLIIFLADILEREQPEINDLEEYVTQWIESYFVMEL